jgi:hypothetical protein
MASSNTAVCADPMNCSVQLTVSCPATHCTYQETLCYVVQLRDHVARVLCKDPKLLEVCVRGRENIAEITLEFES